MTDPRDAIVDTLRRRVLRGVQAGTLRVGDRLPSARDLVNEFRVDYRVIIGAYRQLATEGLVELRPRGGVYVTGREPGPEGVPPLPEAWLAEMLAQGLMREIPGPELHEWLRRATETLRLRAVVISTTEDQVSGLCRELRDDFGLEAEGMTAEMVRGVTPPPLALRRADLLVTTVAQEEWVQELGRELRKPVIAIAARPDLAIGEWALLLRRPVYAVVATPAFGEMLLRFFAEVPGVENLRILVLGRDDLATIPREAPTYITQSAQRELGNTPVPGRVLPAARTIAGESALALFAFIVRTNIEAMSRVIR